MLTLLSNTGAFVTLGAASPSSRATAQMLEDGLKWFVKTEQFCKPFPVVKPHLEAHRAWVAELRAAGTTVTSGYRVDAEGRPGGGGLMIFRAPDHAAAVELCERDPLVANECVEWVVNGWIAEVGDIKSI